MQSYWHVCHWAMLKIIYKVFILFCMNSPLTLRPWTVYLKTHKLCCFELIMFNITHIQPIVFVKEPAKNQQFNGRLYDQFFNWFYENWLHAELVLLFFQYHQFNIGPDSFGVFRPTDWGVHIPCAYLLVLSLKKRELHNNGIFQPCSLIKFPFRDEQVKPYSFTISSAEQELATPMHNPLMHLYLILIETLSTLSLFYSANDHFKFQSQD
jgi:hypothetical protein